MQLQAVKRDPAPWLFFATFLLLGLFFAKDYGVSWDEIHQRDLGLASFRYAFQCDKALFENPDRLYGPAFEMVLIVIEKAMGLDGRDLRSIYLMRHTVNFLVFFLGVVFFYRLVRKWLSNSRWALMACVFLIVSPVIFSHAFYNSKDAVFLALSIVAVYAMVCFLEEPSVKNIFGHALTSAIVVDVRIAGLFVPMLSVLLNVVMILGRAEGRGQRAAGLGICSAAFCFFTVIFWPMLWPDPPGILKQTLELMGKYPRPIEALYFGQFISSLTVPWHYPLVWIVITTPLLYLILALVGLWRSFRDIINNRTWILLGWFFGPLLWVILTRAALYDGWRHLFFIYPALIVLSTIGLQGLATFFPHKKILIGLVALGLAGPLFFMARYHPYEHLYFNALVAKHRGQLRQTFDLDYWGLSFRKGLEYIVKSDRRSVVRVMASNPSALYNVMILPAEDRSRLLFTDDASVADYFISNYRGHPGDYDLSGEVYSIRVRGEKILSVFKLK